MNALKIGTFDPTYFRKYLAEMPTEFWLQNTFRSQWRGLENTESILLKYNTSNPLDLDSQIPEDHPEILKQLNPYLEHLHTLVERSLFRILIARLPAQAEIGLHRDPQEYKKLLRFHWVVKTNENCRMLFRREQFHFANGEIWYFNNLVPHAVKNNGTEERIHVIVDFKR